MIERLRALEIELRNEAEAKQIESQDKKWSEWVRDRAHGRSAGLHEAANRIQLLIAELGQEVGADPIANPPTIGIPRTAYCASTSPAHTSEARDAVTEEAIVALVAGPYKYHHKMDEQAEREGKAFDRCRELTIQHIRTYFATRNACDAAMRQEGS